MSEGPWTWSTNAQSLLEELGRMQVERKEMAEALEDLLEIACPHNDSEREDVMRARVLLKRVRG